MVCCKLCCLLLLIFGLIVAGSLGLFTAYFPYPDHASCTVDWKFGTSCTDAQERLTEQIRAWDHDDCGTQQRCNYDFLGTDGNVIRGSHTTPTFKFVDDFNFTFARDPSGCAVRGMSRSVAWYAKLDFGVNYCNLKNLVLGTGLSIDDPAYTETSNNAICTMYSLAHCHLYN